jgi:hypothetical protein
MAGRQLDVATQLNEKMYDVIGWLTIQAHEAKAAKRLHEIQTQKIKRK